MLLLFLIQEQDTYVNHQSLDAKTEFFSKVLVSPL